eukprot:SAG31_NODE_147_length_22539_cov_37.073663_8_plen_118_part_00
MDEMFSCQLQTSLPLPEESQPKTYGFTKRREGQEQETAAAEPMAETHAQGLVGEQFIPCAGVRCRCVDIVFSLSSLLRKSQCARQNMWKTWLSAGSNMAHSQYAFPLQDSAGLLQEL